MEQFETRFKQVDVLPMVKHFMDELDLLNLFTKYVPAAPDCLADHAESLCILTANIICENKPLYKVCEWLSKYSEGLYQDQEKANLFNDDRLARALSALFDADRHSIMTEVSGNAIAVNKLLTDETHNDSTTVTFMGKYDNPDPEAVKFKHGHNKDFRPDCKQVVFGLNITADGHVPLSYSLYDGNTNDDVTHIPNWNGLRALLGKEDFIYVADCKLCSQKNLIYIAGNGGLFITIVPKDRGEINIYKTYESTRTKDGFRIIFVHSSLKQREDKARREKKIEKAIAKLNELSPKLNAYHLKTKKEIETAVDKICKEAEGLIDVKILTDRKQVTD